MATNPNAMLTVQSNTIFTNVAGTSDGGFFWEGLEKETDPNVSITSWLGEENWSKASSKTPAAHPNSRYTHFCVCWITMNLLQEAFGPKCLLSFNYLA